MDTDALDEAVCRFPYMLKMIRGSEPWQWMPEVEHRLSAIQLEYHQIITKENKHE